MHPELAAYLDERIGRLQANHAATLTRGQQIELAILREIRGKLTV